MENISLLTTQLENSRLGPHRMFASAFAAVVESPILMENRPINPYSNYRRKLYVQGSRGRGDDGALNSADGMLKFKICQQNLWLTTAQKGESSSSSVSLMVRSDHVDATRSEAVSLHQKIVKVVHSATEIKL